MKKSILAAFAVIVMGSTAMAADLPRKAPVYVAPAFSWTGLYVGLNGGYGWGNIDDAGGTDLSGGFFGGQIGYNWQIGQFVIGAEVDAQWADIGNSWIFPLVGSLDSSIDWFGTARLRGGFAVDRALFYVTGGVAWANNEITVTVPPFALSDSQSHVGWVLGAGIEYAFAPNWTAKLEYQYANFGSENYFSGLLPPAGLPSGDVDVSTVRIGVNYLFR